MSKNLSESAQRRKGIFLLCIPVLVIPVLGLLAWNSPSDSLSTQPDSRGLNLEIPGPTLEKKQSSKADAYQSAQRAEKQSEEWPLPDFLNQSVSEVAEINVVSDTPLGFGLLSNSQANQKPGYTTALNDPEKEIKERLLVLDQVVKGKESPALLSYNQLEVEKPKTADPQLLELQYMMDQLLESKKQPDPEIQQLEGLMDKILQLQYPEKYPSPELDLALELDPLPVSVTPTNFSHSATDTELNLNSDLVSNGFYGLEENGSAKSSDLTFFRKTIAASVGRSQEIIPGEALELLLDQDLELAGELLPRGTLLHAKTSLNGSRLQVQVSGILQEGILIPVALNGYGLDGIPGIELSDMKGASQWIQASSRSAQSMNMNLMGMDWQSQLANSGIQATRNLIRTKSRARKIEIKAGHPLLLIDSSTSKSQSL